MIYKTFYGSYIDLSKMVFISEAYFIDQMGFGGWFVGFDMYFQLLEKPIKFRRELLENEYEFRGRHELKLTDGSLTPIPPDNNLDILACINLQKQIDEIVAAWK